MSPPRLEWEDYTTLDEALERVDTQRSYRSRGMEHTFRSLSKKRKSHSYAVLPVPYERGWSARVNGARRDA